MQVSQEKEMKEYRLEREKLSLFANGMEVYVENLKRFSRKTYRINKWVQKGQKMQD